MKLLYITIFDNHYQRAVARELADLLGERAFRFATTSPLSPDRAELGWTGPATQADWMLYPWQDAKQQREFHKWNLKADVVVNGLRNPQLFEDRVRSGKLTFYMSERWFKPSLLPARGNRLGDVWLPSLLGNRTGRLRMLSPQFRRMATRFRNLSRNPCFHYLAIGSHAATDIQRLSPQWTADGHEQAGAGQVAASDTENEVCGPIRISNAALFPGRMWLWGYFPSVGKTPYAERANAVPVIVWAGRMLPWKRLDLLIRAAHRLRNRSLAFRLVLIGGQFEKERLVRKVRALGLHDCVEFVPFLPPSDVRRRMRASDIFVLPSDGSEGWGCVLNEAMAEGCAVVASASAGAAPVLVRPGVNGVMRQSNNAEEWTRALSELLTDPAKRARLGSAAHADMKRRWSPRAAADNLLRRISSVQPASSTLNDQTVL